MSGPAEHDDLEAVEEHLRRGPEDMAEHPDPTAGLHPASNAAAWIMARPLEYNIADHPEDRGDPFAGLGEWEDRQEDAQERCERELEAFEATVGEPNEEQLAQMADEFVLMGPDHPERPLRKIREQLSRLDQLLAAEPDSEIGFAVADIRCRLVEASDLVREQDEELSRLSLERDEKDDEIIRLRRSFRVQG